MEAKLILLLLLPLGWAAKGPMSFDCRFAPGQKLNLPALAGYWYEAARMPNEDVLKCLNVSVPAAPDSDKQLRLQLEYVNMVGPNPYFVNETIAFPWDESTQQGIFTIPFNISLGPTSISYKLIYIDPNHLCVVCGYMPYSSLPITKMFSRQRELNSTSIDAINQLLDKWGARSFIIWTEQSPERCNAAAHPQMSQVIVFGLLSAWLSLDRMSIVWKIN